MNAKRKLLTSVLLSTLLGVGAAAAADYSAWLNQGYFGTPGQGRPNATIKINSTTRNLIVDHFATARIENDKGQNFTWRFDSSMSMTAFPLKTIAPSSFDAGDVLVSVAHPSEHTAR